MAIQPLTGIDIQYVDIGIRKICLNHCLWKNADRNGRGEKYPGRAKPLGVLEECAYLKRIIEKLL